MSSLNNVNTNAHAMSGQHDALPLTSVTRGVQTSESRRKASEANWSNLLFAAKVAYNKGYKSDALQLYRAGLVAASNAMDERDELIEFLTENVWS